MGGSPRAILPVVEEIRPQGTGARRLVPFMGGLSALGLLILVSSLALHLSTRTEGLGGTMFGVGRLGGVYLFLLLPNPLPPPGSGPIRHPNPLRPAPTLP